MTAAKVQAQRIVGTQQFSRITTCRSVGNNFKTMRACPGGHGRSALQRESTYRVPDKTEFNYLFVPRKTDNIFLHFSQAAFHNEDIYYRESPESCRKA